MSLLTQGQLEAQPLLAPVRPLPALGGVLLHPWVGLLVRRSSRWQTDSLALLGESRKPESHAGGPGQL